jgi:hypothetical protein
MLIDCQLGTTTGQAAQRVLAATAAHMPRLSRGVLLVTPRTLQVTVAFWWKCDRRVIRGLVGFGLLGRVEQEVAVDEGLGDVDELAPASLGVTAQLLERAL